MKKTSDTVKYKIKAIYKVNSLAPIENLFNADEQLPNNHKPRRVHFLCAF